MKKYLIILILAALPVNAQEGEFFISFADQDSAQVSVISDGQFSGFQFIIHADGQLEMDILDLVPSELLQDLGYTVSISPGTGVIIGFSLFGAPIPAGEHLLLTLHWVVADTSGWVWIGGNEENPYWVSNCSNLDWDWGDVNGDGDVNVLDIVLVVSYILGQIQCSEEQICAFDYVHDGIINVLDIVYMITHFPDFPPDRK